MGTLLQDVRYGLRMLAKNPSFTLVAVLTLALGIGATAAIFGVVNGVLLKPLPYPQPKRLVEVRLYFRGINESNWGLSPGDYFIFREQSRTFQDIGIYYTDAHFSHIVTGLGEPDQVPGLDVTDGILPILGVAPILGRTFTRADDSPGSVKTAMLTFGYWQRKSGGDRSVVGRTITVDGQSRQIIGVLPQDFGFEGPDPGVLLSFQVDRAKTFLGDFGYESIARLKPGVTLVQANADVARMLPIVERSFPAPPGFSLKELEDLRIVPNLRPLKQVVVGDVGKVLWVLMGGIGLVLLIACANVANLLLVRAEGRQQELAIRAALGASRGRIAAGLLIESFLLALLAGGIGLGLAYAALRVLVAMAPTGLPRLNEIGVDGTVVLFTFAVSLFASLLFGSIPVLKYAGVRLGTGLREGGRSMSESRERHRARGVLVVVQVALALVLLISSGLMIRTFRALIKVEPGLADPADVETFRLYVRIKDPVAVAHTEEELLQKIEAIPGVSSVSLASSLPMDGFDGNQPLLVKERAYTPGAVPLRRWKSIVPGFFKTMGTPLLAGRDFTWSDIYNKLPVGIVSEKLAREYWGDPANALGKQIRVTEKDDWREVVGVVADVRDDGLNQQAPSTVYWPVLTAHFWDTDIDVWRHVAFAIRSSRAGSESLTKEIRKAVWSVDPNLPLADLHTLEYYYSRSMARTTFTLVMLGVAGAMALLLGVVGLYGAIAYSVSQRTHEIGIRVALGAQAEDILKMVVRGGFTLTAIGVGIGLVAALGSTRYVASLLYGVKPTDPPTFVAVSVLLIAVALLASYIPARRATKVDPMVALRHE